MTRKPRVFISYARSDGETFATELRQRLEREASDIELWQDRSRMEGGVGWWKQITEAIDSVEFMVLVMTGHAVTSETVRKEWRYARQQGVCVYPVIAQPPEEIDFRALPPWMSCRAFLRPQPGMADVRSTPSESVPIAARSFHGARPAEPCLYNAPMNSTKFVGI